MPWNYASGTYTPAAGATVAATGQVIQSAVWNSIHVDMALGITQAGNLYPMNTLLPVSVGTIFDTIAIGSGTYDNYLFVFENIILSANAVPLLQFQQGGTFQTVGYLNTAGGQTIAVDLAQTTVGSAASVGFSTHVMVFNANSTSMAKLVRGIGVGGDTTQSAAVSVVAAGFLNATAAIQAARISVSAGVMVSGKVRIYGMR